MAAAALNIVLVEDEPTDAELCQRELVRAGLECAVRRVDTRAAFEAALGAALPDLVLSDFSLPTGFDGMQALHIVRERWPALPFVFVSGTIGEERAVEAMRRGATDYVLKERLARLGPVVRRALAEAAERRARAAAEAELGATQRRLEDVLGSISDGVWSAAVRPFRVLYLNPAVARIWGHPVDTSTDAAAWAQALHPDDLARLAPAWTATAVAGEPFDAVFRVVRADGGVRWVHAKGLPVRGDDGAVIRIDGTATDITVRREQEERIRRLNRIYAMSSGIGSAIVRVKDRSGLFADACRIAVEGAGFRMAWIGDVDPASGTLRPLALHGLDDGYLDAVGIARQTVAEHPGAASRAIRTGRPVVANDLAHDPDVVDRTSALQRGYRALAALPLFLGASCVAVMVLYATEAGSFNAEEMKLLEELTGNISFALDHLEKTARVDYLAYYDGVTGLANRTLYFDRLDQLLRRGPGACVVLDIERFHTLNDTYGVPAGDALLHEVARRLQSVLPGDAVVSRLSGDRYAYAVPTATETRIAMALQQQVLPALGEPLVVADTALRIALKAGIAIAPHDGRDAHTLLTNAEAALESAKQDAARYRFYRRDMNVSVADRLARENALRGALERGEFILHYQPRVALADGRLTGLEALLRWQSPLHGLVMPGEFIGLLEETGLIVDVGCWVVQAVSAQCRVWHEEGLQPPRVALNASALQLRQSDFVPGVLDAIVAGGGRGEWLNLEVTESMLMNSLDDGIAKLAALREAGLEVSLDDFGTGYSSLSYLARLPVDALKIDRSFVAGMSSAGRATAIVASIVSLGRSLGLNVIAEGVETALQASQLRELGCGDAQGFLFDRPLPAAAVAVLLGRHAGRERGRAAGGR